MKTKNGRKEISFGTKNFHLMFDKNKNSKKMRKII